MPEYLNALVIRTGGAWTFPVFEMYLVTMDQLARDDIAAAAAAHHELGRDYDGAVAEGLIERIGDEIDKRVDARLGQRDDRHPRRNRLAQRDGGDQLSPAARSAWPGIVLALGSMGLGIGASSAVLQAGGNSATVCLIWIIIAIINVAYARRR
jgi:hypothetical protein